MKVLKICFSLVFLLSIVACGVKSSPAFPEGSSYPKQYPSAR